jgi:hypothetical protein
MSLLACIKIFKKIKKLEPFDIGMERNVTEADFWFVPRKVYFSFSECLNRVCVHTGSKLSETNSKKIQKCETFAWHHFMSPRCGKKNSNLEKNSLQESLFTEMS